MNGENVGEGEGEGEVWLRVRLRARARGERRLRRTFVAVAALEVSRATGERFVS